MRACLICSNAFWQFSFQEKGKSFFVRFVEGAFPQKPITHLPHSSSQKSSDGAIPATLLGAVPQHRRLGAFLAEQEFSGLCNPN